MSAQSMQTSGPPYASSSAGLGGLPTTALDVPITSVFLALFIGAAAFHMTILQKNNKRSHKFLPSGALFGFCMARTMACVLRICWATRPTNVSLAIAANVFLNAGVVIIIIINILFGLRILRAMNPKLGWSRPVHFLFMAYFVSIPCILAALITAIVQMSFTLNQDILPKDRIITLVGGTYFAVAAFVPIPLLLFSIILRKISAKTMPNDKFGSGRFRTKIIIVMLCAILISLGAAFRAGIAYVPRPASNPAWYHSKACFYVFDFTIEIIVIYSYAALRVDRRFWVPNGSSKVRHFRGDKDSAEEVEMNSGISERSIRLETDEELKADFMPEGQDVDDSEKEGDLEAGQAAKIGDARVNTA